MKKLIFVIPLTILLSGLFITKSYASVAKDDAGTVIVVERADTGYFELVAFVENSVSFFYYDNWNSYMCSGTFAGYSQPASSWTINSTDIWGVYNYWLDYTQYWSYSGYPDFGIGNDPNTKVYVLKGSCYISVSGNGNDIDTENYPVVDPPDPDEPEPGSTWLSDLWEWVLWQLGLNDDYSGDIDAYITGGDRPPFELVTPSPTPSPTPVPSPTPYSLDIVDNNGNPIYTITGIPGNTYNIINTTNNNDGSDFDIFEVDLKIGDGGSSNPRDGINNVMSSSEDYLSDNVDTSLIGDLFSVIPNDWFLFIGVLAGLPFIAGFISKLLK